MQPDRRTDRPTSSHRGDRRVSQPPNDTKTLSTLPRRAWVCAHVHMCVYVSVYVLRAAQRPGQAVRDYGGWVSQNPDPIQPSSAQKKKKKSLERVTADWQTEWKTKSDTQQRQQRDSGVKRTVWNEQGLKKKKAQECNRYMERQGWSYKLTEVYAFYVSGGVLCLPHSLGCMSESKTQS